jgi:D-beta-D-heptose 7-phosphate kinase / D-beta-D-heptose 1-phosphate adenosyltransferase
MIQDRNFTGVNVTILGDIILDKYIYGEVHRISPESPVPVLKVTKETNTLGGAANVAHNITSLGGHVNLIGIVGKDRSGRLLKRMFSNIGINDQTVFSTEPTTTKTRIIGNHQHIARMDYERTEVIGKEVETVLYGHFVAHIEDTDIVVLSDYHKGVLSRELCIKCIKLCNEKKIFVIVDPKGNDWAKYRNATLVKPNIREYSEITGKSIVNSDAGIENYGSDVLRKYGLKYLLVTRSEMGMSLISNHETYHLPTVGKEVFDVSGAGDTVIGTLALCLGRGNKIKEAIEVANVAAGIVVGKIGTATVSLDDLKGARNLIDIESKYAEIAKLKILVEKLKQRGSRIILTNGCFDVLHRGHLTLLEKAKTLGDILIVALNSDKSVRRLKGNSRPINSIQDRAHMLSSLEFVDFVVGFEEDTPEVIISEIRPHVLVKGGDYAESEILGREYAENVVIIDYEKGYSTTNILERLK